MIAIQPVAATLSRVAWRKHTALNGVDVQPAIAVVIEQSDAAAHCFGRRTIVAQMTIVVHKSKSGGLGTVSETW